LLQKEIRTLSIMPLSLLERLEFISFSTLGITQFPDILK